MLDEDQCLSEKDIRRALSIMMVHGIDIITSYYGENILDSDARTRLNHFIDENARIVGESSRAADALLYYPFEELCAVRRPMGSVEEADGCDSLKLGKSSELLLKNQICFDIADTEYMKKCTIANGKMTAPDGNRVRWLVFPDISFLPEQAAAVVREALSAGVRLLVYGKKRIVSGLPQECEFVDHDSIIENSETVHLQGYRPGILMSHRRNFDDDLFLLVNTEQDEADVTIVFSDGEESTVFLEPGTVQILRRRSVREERSLEN